MLRIVLSTVAAVLAATPAQSDPLPNVAPEKVGLSSEGLQRVGSYLKSEVEKGRLPGAVVAVARRGQIAYVEAVGHQDPASKAPMPRDAIFSIASMTKPMVSVAIMMLHDEGKLLLSDPVAKFLPALGGMKVGVIKTDPSGKEVVEAVPAATAPTIQDLLRHTSGFTYGGRGTTAIHKQWPVSSTGAATTFTGSEFIEALSKVPLLYQPGTVWDYGLSTDVLGLVVEAVTGKPLKEFLEDRIWKPLGMTDTSFVVPDSKRTRYAIAFPNDPVTKNPQSILHATGRPLKFDCGGGCAVSTAMDYMRFLQMFLNGGTLDGKRLLSRKTVEFMSADHLTSEVKARTNNSLLPPGYGFGLGFIVRSQTGIAITGGSAGEYGWSGAFGTFFLIDPKEQLIFVFMSAAPGAVLMQNSRLVKNLIVQSVID